MREYLRRHASEGWIIDLTPEGQTPDVPTRIFPGVRQPLAIGLFLRTPDASDQFPAAIRYRSVSGRQTDKFAALAGIRLDDDGWREARTGWTEPLTPAAAGGWDTYPALSDLMPWYSPGVFPTRTWVYAPNAETLRRRWQTVMGESDPKIQSQMFKEGRDATMDKAKDPLPGSDTHRSSSGPLRLDYVTQPHPVRVGYRSFDRQWVLPDSRLMDMPRPQLVGRPRPRPGLRRRDALQANQRRPRPGLLGADPGLRLLQRQRRRQSLALSAPGRDAEPSPGTDHSPEHGARPQRLRR